MVEITGMESVPTFIVFLFVFSGENAEEEHYSYIDHKKEQLNVLYDNRY